MEGKEIVVYTVTGCQHCAGVKAYLNEKGIEFTERNVLEDEQAMADFKELGFRGTPVTLVGEEAIVGFDRKRFEELLPDSDAGES
ncbi:MAG: glutaredoxin family protein [Candidatus Eisenbacteria bacterium]